MLCQLADLATLHHSLRRIYFILQEQPFTSPYEHEIAEIHWLLSVCIADFVGVGELIAPDVSGAGLSVGMDNAGILLG
jgi:hypothetical protein